MLKKAHSRTDLKNNFLNGRIPTETHFSDLIDSMVNRQDDGLSKDDENGLILSASKSTRKLITLFDSIDQLKPFFYIEKDERKDEKKSAGLRLNPYNELDESGKEKKSFFFDVNGSMGIGKRSHQDYSLDVNGFAAMQGRVGTFVQDKVAANGKWHTIIDKLDNCQAFEVMARTGKKTTGKYSILHAYALSAFGRSSSKIRRTCAYNGFFWNKIGIRWKSKGIHNYALQLRTNSNYGADIFIDYKVTKLWDDEKFLSNDHFYQHK